MFNLFKNLTLYARIAFVSWAICSVLGFMVFYINHAEFGKNIRLKQEQNFQSSIEKLIEQDIERFDNSTIQNFEYAFSSKSYVVQVYKNNHLVYWNNSEFLPETISPQEFQNIGNYHAKSFELKNNFKILCFYKKDSTQIIDEKWYFCKGYCIEFILFGWAVFFYIVFIRYGIARNESMPYYKRVLSVALALLFLKIVLKYFSFPSYFNQFEIANALSFANKYLGDSIFTLFIHVLMLYVFVDAVLHEKNNDFRKFVKRNVSVHYTSYLLLLIAVILYAAFSKFVSAIIFDSNIPLNLIDFTSYTASNFIFVLTLCLSFWIFTKLIYFFSSSFRITYKNSWSDSLISFLFCLLLLSIIFHENNFPFLFFYALNLIFFIDVILRFQSRKFNNYYIVIYFLIVTSVAFSINTIYYKNIKEKASRALIANSFSRVRNPLFEMNIQSFSAKIREDSLLQTALIQNDAFQAIKRVNTIISENQFEEFQHKVFVFDSINRPIVNNNLPYTYFKHKTENAYQKLNDKLFLVAFNNEGFSYISIDTLVHKTKIIIDWSDKELIRNSLSDYGFSYYKKRNLLYSTGNNNYSLQAFLLPKITSDTFIEINRNSFYFKRLNASETVIISKPYDRWYDYFSIFSVFFTFSFLIFILYLSVLLIFKALILKSSIGNLALKTLNDKIILSYYVLVFLLFLIAGFFNFFIFVQNKNANITYQLREAQMLLNKEFGKTVLSSNNNMNNVQKRMMELEGLVNNPITLYDEKGKFIQHFNEASGSNFELLNFDIYIKLVHGKFSQTLIRTGFFQIDKSLMISVIKNEINGKIIGFFKLQPVVKNNAKYYNIGFNAFFNVFVLLIILGSIIAYFISKALIEPLLNLSFKINVLKLGKSNTKLYYEADDEIGTLVKEYNLMVDKLDESAKKLAASERDFAWNEMAKQIAHEIKNPLTPMKLSLQLLQRAIAEDSPQIKELTQRLAVTLLEQIENLSNIANEFSQFAKIKEANIQNYNVNEIVKNSVSLFRSEFEGEITLNENDNNIRLNIDKNQMMQVMNNLLKNAIQAMENVEFPALDVELIRQENEVIISVKDNGVGIQKDDDKNIFEPNFTTKNSGTGLGLSISKKIIENFGGRIYYNSEVGLGTTFFVALPLAQNDENI